MQFGSALVDPNHALKRYNSTLPTSVFGNVSQ